MNLWKFKPAIEGALKRAGIPMNQLEDVVQDVFIVAIPQLHTLTHEGGATQFLAMQVRTVLSKRAKHFNFCGRNEAMHVDIENARSLGNPGNQENIVYLAEMKRQLPPLFRAHIDGADLKDLAEAYDISYNVLRSDVCRFRKELREAA